MTTENEAREAVYGRFVDQWGDTTVIVLGAEKHTPTDGVAWARCSTREIASTQESLGPVGGRIFTRRDMIQIQIYSPAKGEGSDTARYEAYADELRRSARAIFEGVRFDGLTTGEADARPLGVDGGKWLVSLVKAECQYQETK